MAGWHGIDYSTAATPIILRVHLFVKLKRKRPTNEAAGLHRMKGMLNPIMPI